MKDNLSVFMLVLIATVLVGAPVGIAAGGSTPKRDTPTFDEETEEDKIPSLKELRENAEHLTFVEKCVFQTAPNYAPCADPDDARQLIDGATAGAAWNNAGTVGWDFSKLDEKKVTLTISMKRLAFITNLRMHFACGRWAGVSLPENVWVSIGVDGKRYPMRLKYLTDTPTDGDEKGQPLAGWIFAQDIVQLGKHIKIEFEMKDRGDLLLLDEIQVFGLTKTFIFFRKNMPFWLYWAPGAEIERLGNDALVAEGNLLLNPMLTDTDNDGLPDGMRLETDGGATAKASVADAGGARVISVTRGDGDQNVNLVIATIGEDAKGDRNAVLTADVKSAGGCKVRVETPGVAEAIATKEVGGGDWQTISVPVTIAKGTLPRVRMTLGGASMSVRNLNLTAK